MELGSSLNNLMTGSLKPGASPQPMMQVPVFDMVTLFRNFYSFKEIAIGVHLNSAEEIK